MNNIQENRTEISDLPVELLEIIFSYCALPDLKRASRVCLLWSDLTFSSRRMKHVWLEVAYCERKPQYYYDLYGRSKRQYRKIHFTEHRTNNANDRMMQWYHANIATHPTTISTLEWISLKLTHLRVDDERTVSWEWLDIFTNAPNLESIDMNCDTECGLEVYKHFSGQLKSLKTCFWMDKYAPRFFEINFSRLEDIALTFPVLQQSDNNSIRMLVTFFARLKRLRRAKLSLPMLPILQVLAENCRDLTSLHIGERFLESQSLNVLPQFTGLKILSLSALTGCATAFEKCEPMPSLREIRLEHVYATDSKLQMYKELLRMAPQLHTLHLSNVSKDAECVQFICSKFVRLERLHLEEAEMVHTVAFRGIDALEKIIPTGSWINGIQIRNSKVRRLTLRVALPESYLKRIPQMFPSLNSLTLDLYQPIAQKNMASLRFLMPACSVVDLGATKD